MMDRTRTWFRRLRVVLIGALWLSPAVASAQQDAELAAMIREFDEAVNARTAALDASYLERLEELEADYVEAGDFVAAAMVVAEIEAVSAQRVVVQAVEAEAPEGGVLTLEAGAASVRALQLRDDRLVGWEEGGEATWGFAPVPQGSYRVVIEGRGQRAGRLEMRLEEIRFYLEGGRDLEEGESIRWDLGYLRLSEGAELLRGRLLADGVGFELKTIELHSPASP